MVDSAHGVVLSRAGGSYRVYCDGQVVECTLRGRVKHRSGRKVLVGDRVVLTEGSDGGLTVEGVLERTSLLQRRSPGRSRGSRSVAANLDRVVVVGAAESPTWDQHMMDRFVVVAEANDLPVTVVINKVDLVENAEEIAAVYATVGYETIQTSTTTNLGLARLADVLAGATTLFTGPTGVGKSSLLNAIQPGLRLKTGAVSRKSGAGRHTTVAAEMFPLDMGGFVVDTPGLRDIGLWGIDPADVSRAFPEIAAVAGGCRFADCRHLVEPDCAAVRATEDGAIAPARLASYRRFLAEVVEAGKQW